MEPEKIVEQIMALLSQLPPEAAAAVVAKLAEGLGGGEGEAPAPQPMGGGSSPMGGPNGVPVQ